MWNSVWVRRINYLTLVLFVGFGLIFYHHYMLMVMMVVILVTPVISYLVAKKSIDRFSVAISCDKQSVGKEIPVEVCFTVENRSFYPVENLTLHVRFFNQFFGNDEEYQLVVGAVPKKKRQVRMHITGIYCGRMRVVLDKIDIYDLFCMFRFVKELNEAVEIDIIPTRSRSFEHVELSTMGVSEDEEIQMKKGDDVSQISEIRDYIPGDKLQNIHWKLSAKSEELQVKEFSLPYSEDVVVLVEMYAAEEEPQVFDEQLEMLYAFSHNLLTQGRKFSIVWKETEFTLREMEVYHNDDLNSVIHEMFFAGLEKKNGETYELYAALHPQIKGTVLYLSNAEMTVKSGEKLEIGSERVKLTWLR